MISGNRQANADGKAELMDEQSIPDPELGDDPDRTGVYEFDRTLFAFESENEFPKYLRAYELGK